MRWWRPVAAKSCWSIFSKASARPRWCNARARAKRERRRDRFAVKRSAAALARPGDLDDRSGYLCSVDRAGAAVVDVAGRCFRALLAWRGSVDPRLPGLLPVAETPEMLSADRSRCVGRRWHAVVRSVVDRTSLRGHAGRKI